MDSYVFRNEMKFGNRAAQRKLLLRLAGVLLLAVFVLKTVLDGFSVITLWLVLLGLIFLGRKGSPVTVEDVLTEISFAPGHVTLVYRGHRPSRRPGAADGGLRDGGGSDKDHQVQR